MIISHTNNFVYFKAHKVAGTSVLQGLSQLCGEGDVVARIYKKVLFGQYAQPVDFPDLSQNSEDMASHTTPRDMVKNGWISEELLKKYTKITVVRNPWDRIVSACVFRRDNGQAPKKRRTFDQMCLFNKNAHYYRNRDGSPAADIYLRFENLHEEYADLCRGLGFEPNELPKLRSGYRKDREYRSYFTDEQAENVRKTHAWEIERFGYEF
jgi:hypothetical protein